MTFFKKFLSTSPNIPWPALLLFSLALIAATIFAVKTTPATFGIKAPQSVITNPTQLLAEENKRLISEVAQLIALPEDETPTIATVTDLEKAKTQPFFKNAQIGDKVLVYQSIKKAILYRPSENRIIEVGKVKIESPQYQIESTPPISITPQVSLSPTPPPATPKFLVP